MTNIANKKRSIAQILDIIPDDADIIIPIGNGEPNELLNAIDQDATRFRGVHIHQMLELRDRGYINGLYPEHVRYTSYFMGAFARKAYRQRKCDLVPNHFQQAPQLLMEITKRPLVLAMASPMNENGYFSLGTQADYASPFIGNAPFILEVNEQMPRTYGDNQVHISEVLAYHEVNYPLYELFPLEMTNVDRQIAAYVAERIHDGDTLQIGIGGIPNAIMSSLHSHKDLGIHTEMLTDSVVDLVERSIITGARKITHIGKIVATFVLGTQRLYDFIHENHDLEMLRVDYVNDPRTIALEDNIVSINSTTEVNFYGECASETVSGQYYSSTGGQADFATGARLARNGRGFICLPSTAKNGTISRIRPYLTQGSVVTTTKNIVDCVVTEYGVAELKGKSVAERTKALINIAHPKFRDELTADARKYGFI